MNPFASPQPRFSMKKIKLSKSNVKEKSSEDLLLFK